MLLPAIRFLVFGGLLYAASVANSPDHAAAPRADRSPIFVDAVALEEMRLEYVESVGTEPDRKAYDYLIAKRVDNELLYREALAMGLDRGDSAVRYRLIEKMEYLGEADEEEIARDPDGVVERAIEMGLTRSDPIVRNAMVQKYRMLVRFATIREPERSQLEDYFARNRERFTRPARVSFDHVFISKDKRGDSLSSDVHAVGEKLLARDLEPRDAFALGDVFLSGHSFTKAGPAALLQAFGPEFSDAVGVQPVGEWAGPVASSFGQHFVRVRDKSGAADASLDDVYSQVRMGLIDELRDVQLRAKLDELRDVYEVRVDWEAVSP